MKTHSMGEAANLLGVRTRPFRLRLQILRLAEERGERIDLFRVGGTRTPWRVSEADLLRLFPALAHEPDETEPLRGKVAKLERQVTWLITRVCGQEMSDEQ